MDWWIIPKKNPTIDDNLTPFVARLKELISRIRTAPSTLGVACGEVRRKQQKTLNPLFPIWKQRREGRESRDTAPYAEQQSTAVFNSTLAKVRHRENKRILYTKTKSLGIYFVFGSFYVEMCCQGPLCLSLKCYFCFCQREKESEAQGEGEKRLWKGTFGWRAAARHARLFLCNLTWRKWLLS